MTTLLHIDASARPGRSGIDPHGSHSRRLSARFVEQWQKARPGDRILYRDVGQHPPHPVSGEWIHAAFTKPETREPWMHDVLAESDALVDELLEADVIVAGVPMYNFGVPAGFKAYIDNIVRVGRTFGFDRSRQGLPYWPMLTEMSKRLVVLSARGDYGYAPGERMAQANHVEPHIRTVFGYLGIDDVHTVAVEYDEFGGEHLQASLAQAEQDIEALVAELTEKLDTTSRIFNPA
ncbi:NAD(P)H dehydrogenase [Halomonas sp. MCCC 1A17488]|uniref:FMN-dependent NADH-azoreductase n=1 Tax=unclassified Halomonas TaxID=2609666 RepID=UPI0018D22620|nr:MULTISPECIES: NAD(P)H-dependent oxidoreductase [unclassified Halomonas]MCE8016500.1 NAD(P)H dehydrogenase [Halomonas sp. MCCC 1A17488]MCG3239833.1 NAD(P)H dehydrogenase [Halomonas sp. MCCC 1A17488]QPP50267.1 NAD(P)H-dependent oxidoreductase [Halomonas sp. SS10-MC5]